jgi:hypothetical protein
MKRFVWMGWMVTRLLFGRRERFVEAAILDLPEKDRQFTNAHATLTQQFDNAVSHVRRHFRLSLIASVAILVVGWMFAYLIAGCFKWPSVPTSLQIASVYFYDRRDRICSRRDRHLVESDAAGASFRVALERHVRTRHAFGADLSEPLNR